MGPPKTPATRRQIGEAFLSQLRKHIAAREIERGIARLQENAELIVKCDLEDPYTARFVAHVSVWVDIGFDGLEELKDLLQQFTPDRCSRLSLSDYLQIRMAAGMVAMREEAMEVAIGHFDFVLSLAQEMNDSFLLAIVNYWKGRCLRKRGEYGEALIFTCRGRDLALELGHQRMAAVMQVLESWLLFQQGKSKEAARISKDAETTLRDTEDYVTLGNIQSFYGRLARREGRFDKAIELFTIAIEQFRKRDSEHPNLARSLANMALAKRGIALQLQRRIDHDAQRHRKAPGKDDSKRSSRSDYRGRLLQLRKEALEHLAAAHAIYQRRPTVHGVGTLSLNAAYIHLDNSDFHTAEKQADSAFHLAEEKQDYILMCRARVLQCMIENAKVEEEISEGADPGRHARRALEFIQSAVDLAKQTQHELLLARAYLWQGLTHCNSFFDDSAAARQSYDLARASCKSSQPDSLWQELQSLRARIQPKGSVNPTLKAWSQGAIGDKTFRQISEEFAELVIPRVWEREDRKVSRVAERLSISPKKVRRILARAGKRKP
ncbi:MAG TPA: tetratricopeptide repeat protein [Terriglobales bacterium]|nr:tetratricopeptide repeat protein [Terriglobales bacterium]